jgi:peptidoglycan/LPS O-acetylase OafA/YrhL
MRIEVLTFLRFIAAAVVVIFHFGRKSSIVTASPGFLTAGPEMVSFFFVLSGFVLAVSHWNRTEQPLWRFYWARFWRIAPIYYVAFTATVMLRPHYDASTLAAHASFLQSWLLGLAINVNFPAWSISVEMFFYAIFPFVLSIVRLPRWRPRTLLTASLVAWAMTEGVVVYLANAHAVAAPVIHELIYYFPLVHLSSFLLGVMGGAWYRTQDVARPRKSIASSLLATASLIVGYLACEHRAQWSSSLGVFIPTAAGILSPLYLGIILALARADGPVARFFSSRVFRVLGEASYGVYILQYPVIAAYARYLAPASEEARRNELGTAHFLRYAGILLALSIASAYLFERPLRRFMSDLVRKTRPLANRVEADPAAELVSTVPRAPS